MGAPLSMLLSRRNAIVTSGAFLALAACGRGGGGGAVLRVGSQKGGTKALMLASGALAGAAYSVEWSDFPAAQNLLEAIGSGAVDLGLVGDAPFQFAYQSGSPVRVVGAMRAKDTPPGALAILVAKGSPAHSIRDLAGKRVATTRGSVGHYLVLRALGAAGLAPGAVKIVYLSPSDARAALQTGAIDGWSTWVPYTVAAMAEGARIVTDGLPFSSGSGFDVASDAAIAGKRALLADFLVREGRAMDWAQAHPADYAKVLVRETGLPQAIARATVDRNSRVRAPIDASLIAEQQIVLDTFRASGDVKGARALKDAFVPLA